MKGLYITLVVLAILIITMLVLAFFYLDQQKHQVFKYTLSYNSTPIAYETVDRYLLENSLIYKSTIELPRDILRRRSLRKIAFGVRGKKFIDYAREVFANGSKNIIYIENGGDGTSFMAAGSAKFAYLDKVPHLGNFVIFESEVMATYPSLIRRYNFKRRGEQFVHTLIPVSNFLPPVSEIVSVIYSGRDTIEIEGRKIKCELLLFELEHGELISVWVSRTFHNVLKVKIPMQGFSAVLRTKEETTPVEEYRRESSLYSEKEVTFNNEEAVLCGTLSVPNVERDHYPTVLLVWDSGPMDRDSLGIFTDIAHDLAEKGYCVLRFDKRGIGESQGFFSTYAQPEEIADLGSAIEYLKSIPEVDKSRIAVLGYSEGGFYATHLASTDEAIRGCVILSAVSSLGPDKNNFEKFKEFVKNAVTDDEEYLVSAIETIKQSRELIKTESDKGDWITISGERVFIRKMNLEDTYDPLETIKKVKVPVLILHGKKDFVNLPQEAKELGDALMSGGNDNFTTVYFGELDHHFGNLVRGDLVRDHFEVDAEVLKTVSSWLDENLVSPPPLPPVTEEVETGLSPEIPPEEKIDEKEEVKEKEAKIEEQEEGGM